MRVLVCGSRNWEHEEIIVWRLDELQPSEIIQGGAAGADLMAFTWACDNAVPVTTYEPNYQEHGRSAPLKRNIAMLDTNPDLVLAFWNGQSRGTKHTIDQARKRGIKVEVIEG